MYAECSLTSTEGWNRWNYISINIQFFCFIDSLLYNHRTLDSPSQSLPNYFWEFLRCPNKFLTSHFLLLCSSILIIDHCLEAFGRLPLATCLLSMLFLEPSNPSLRCCLLLSKSCSYWLHFTVPEPDFILYMIGTNTANLHSGHTQSPVLPKHWHLCYLVPHGKIHYTFIYDPPLFFFS